MPSQVPTSSRKKGDYALMTKDAKAWLIGDEKGGGSGTFRSDMLRKRRRPPVGRLAVCRQLVVPTFLL